jgi:NAD(P)-dependent dehydrogenase (short-subunit alcohol dehydrogenase family)
MGTRVALITGASRGIGAAAALALAERGLDVILTYRNKAARAQVVAREVEARGRRSLALAADITQTSGIDAIRSSLQGWARRLDVLVLNASGGLERDLVAADPEYPMRINHDAQLAVLDASLPFLCPGSTVVFVTSHWAHRYGDVVQLPSYEPVARTKFAGEQALRSRQKGLAERNVRLIVVTGDLVEGTITPKLLERAGPGMTSTRETLLGRLPTTGEMGRAIADAALDASLPTGHTVVVGGALDTLPSL